jgi:cytochrome c553
MKSPDSHTVASAFAWVIALSLGTAAWAAEGVAKDGYRPSAEQIRFFETTIRPLLANHCYECHGAETQESNLRLDSLAGILVGGSTGSAVVPGKPGSSLILTAISYRDNELRMPPDGRLSDRQIADLTRWVETGAPHPDSGEVNVIRYDRGVNIAEGRQHWAFQAPVKPDVPELRHRQVDNPIDAFILAALEQKGLGPLDPADKRTLIRRATFDLIGLPPTPEEIDAFVADTSDDAFRRVVDRLLASPHYGERWGRHWLDIARYADSNGLDENVTHGNAWRYRDYVVRSFNDDKPYDAFLMEQLAGDLLDSGTDSCLRRERLIATGFLVLGPKVLAEVDEAKMEMDIVDEQIDTIGRSLMGLTLGCARCHDHKFDPIGQDDYYALAGIFKSTRTMETFTKIARWNENVIALPADIARKEEHERLVAEKKQQIDDRIAIAKCELTPTGETLSSDVEQRFTAQTQAEIQKLRDELKQLEESAPVLPTAMGVVDGTVADTSVHLRGSHLTLGDVVPRRFPQVLAGDDQPRLPDDRSGRLELARWLTDGKHPLTARVMVNRIWRWHFGRGLVPPVDNLGRQGTPPTHPKLLDWLAVRFVEEGWSIKAMHRLMMLSEAYQRSSGFESHNAAADPGNQFYWRYDIRRLEAETIRDALLAVSGTLDQTMGGSLLTTKNREFVFDHTSQDKSRYDHIRRRSIYVPVIRNHLYDFFQLFDYTDASVLNGNRDTSTIAPQALLLMNSDFVADLTTAMADRLLATDASREARINQLFQQAYGRPPSAAEAARAAQFLIQFEKLPDRQPGDAETTRTAWQSLCQSIVSSSEFVYVR